MATESVILAISLIAASVSCLAAEKETDPFTDPKAFIQACKGMKMAADPANEKELGADNETALAAFSMTMGCGGYVRGMAEAISAQQPYLMGDTKVCVPASARVEDIIDTVVAQEENAAILDDPDITTPTLVMATIAQKYPCK